MISYDLSTLSLDSFRLAADMLDCPILDTYCELQTSVKSRLEHMRQSFFQRLLYLKQFLCVRGRTGSFERILVSHRMYLTLAMSVMICCGHCEISPHAI